MTDSVIAVDSLLSWLRDQVAGYGLDVSDVCDAFNRGDVLCAIINRFRPDLIEFPLPSEENIDPLDIAACRNQIAFDILQEEFGLNPVGYFAYILSWFCLLKLSFMVSQAVFLRQRN